MITWGGALAALVLAAGLAVTLHDVVARPALRRLAARNVRRRGREALLVILGSSLGTAAIVASLLVGATFHASLRDGARRTLGPIDEQLEVRDVGRLDDVLRAVTRPRLPDAVDGVLPVVTGTATLASAERASSGRNAPRQVRPVATVAEMDVVDARAFGDDLGATGLGSLRANPHRDAVVLNQDAASDLGVERGATVVVRAYGSARSMRVEAVLPQVGLAGFADALVAPGTLEAMRAAQPSATGLAPAGVVLVSNRGGTFTGASHTASVVAKLRHRVGGMPGVEVRSVKQDLLDEAAAEGRAMGQLFVGVGSFSVLAGALLVVNLVVMLAEERRRELGLARVLGLRRGQVARLFAMEGTLYAAGAAFVGGLLGTGLGWLLVFATRHILGDVADFHLRFVAPAGVASIGAVVGFGVAVATVWVTSLRIAHLTVVRALRDLPALPHRRHRPHTVGLGVGSLVGGTVCAVWGVHVSDPLGTLLGPPLALVGLAVLALPRFSPRLVRGAAASGVLVCCAGVYAFVPAAGESVPIPVFVVQGIVLVIAAVVAATSADHLWVAVVERLSRAGRGLAARLGLAYPLARPARTAMLLATYALVVFTLSFLAIYGKIFGAQVGTFADQQRAGTQVVVDMNPANPVAAERLTKVAGVARVVSLWRGTPTFTAPFAETPTRWPVTGFDASLLKGGVPALSARSPRFASDRAVFEALLADDDLVVVDAQFLATSAQGQPQSAQVRVGDRVTAAATGGHAPRQLQVVGILANDTAGAGAYLSTSDLDAISDGTAVPSRAYVQVRPGADSSRVARVLERDLAPFGVQARTFRAVAQQAVSVQLGFFHLMEGYLLLGLFIGAAGVGVVMVRAVRERRRQIGMLRAMGFSREIVRRAFRVEVAFVALQGSVMGLALGLLLSYQMLTRSAALGGDPLPYSVPWGVLGVLALLPLLASLAAVVVPASQAARVQPARALYRSD